jgi:MFS family permease
MNRIGPKYVKLRALLSISFFTFIAAMNPSCIAPALFGLVKEFHVTPQKVSLVVSLNVLMSGLGSLFWVPFTRKFGKLTIFLLV